MRPITLHTPKPLVRIGGLTMLDRALDHLAAAGVKHAVVNLHHLAATVRQHLARRQTPRIAFSDETAQLLETGGGVRKALPLLGSGPFLVLNADIVWLNGETPALDRLHTAWDSARMDALLLLNPREASFGYDGAGDFHLEKDGRISGRRRDGETAPYIFAGVQILSPTLFENAPGGAWSLNRVYDAALQRGRLFGLVHDGPWFHVGTPQDIAPTEARLKTLDGGG